jgi:hypothetical protein
MPERMSEAIVALKRDEVVVVGGWRVAMAWIVLFELVLNVLIAAVCCCGGWLLVIAGWSKSFQHDWRGASRVTNARAVWSTGRSCLRPM